MDISKIQYKLIFHDGTEKIFELHLRSDSLLPVGWAPRNPPDWTALDYNKCAGCPLNSSQQAYCPAALNLAKMIDGANELDLLDTVKLVVKTADRTVAVSATVQKALGSFIGLLMATSECPPAAYFRPLARFHLPLATESETVFRVVTTFAMAQFLRRQAGLKSEEKLDGLYEVYRHLEEVNTGLANRLKQSGLAGAISKCLLEWDVFSGMFPIRADEVLKQMQPLFAAYLEK